MVGLGDFSGKRTYLEVTDIFSQAFPVNLLTCHYTELFRLRES